jgi:hypothetical protein
MPQHSFAFMLNHSLITSIQHKFSAHTCMLQLLRGDASQTLNLERRNFIQKQSTATTH